MSQQSKPSDAPKPWTIAPETKAQREYVTDWNVPGDIAYAAMLVRRFAKTFRKAARHDDEAACAAHNIGQIAKRLDLLVRAMKRRGLR